MIRYMGKSPLPAKMNAVSPVRHVFRSIYELYSVLGLKTSRGRENEGKNLCDEVEFDTVFCDFYLLVGYPRYRCVVDKFTAKMR